MIRIGYAFWIGEYRMTGSYGLPRWMKPAQAQEIVDTMNLTWGEISHWVEVDGKKWMRRH